MVGFSKEGVQLSSIEHAAAGAVSGGISRALFQPLDVLKIRFQLQVEPIRRNGKSMYSGILQATSRIVREEGVSALWKGHVPAQLLSILFGLVEFSAFEMLTKLVWYTCPEEMTTTYRPFTHTVCGAVAGCVSTLAVQPVDVMRTRFISQKNVKVYKSLWSGMRTVIQQEGPRGLYKGLLPAVSQVGPQMGLQFGYYTLFTEIWNRVFHRNNLKPPGISESVVCGFGAGIVSKSIIYPLDVVKKRLQIQGFKKEARAEFGSVRVYSGLRHCINTMLKEEGIFGFYKGLSPSLLKAGIFSASHFFIYEQVCEIFKIRHSPK